MRCHRGWKKRAGAACAALAAVNAAGQAPEPIGPIGPPIHVEVTGSRLPRTDVESALPIQVITREDIEHAGIVTVQDLVERVSAVTSFGSVNPAMGEASTSAGLTAASLRGLGTQRTLVLLNGQRLAPYALDAGKSIDLSAIPLAAIDKVEVLKDGASAIYGTDAIGGVINFILRKDYRGAEVTATGLGTVHGGGGSARASLLAGFGDLARDRYNAFAAIDYHHQDPLAAADRPFSRTGVLPGLGVNNTSSFSFPANLRQRPQLSLANPTIPASGPTAQSCDPPASLPLPPPFRSGPLTACRYDALSTIEIIPEVEKVQTVARAVWRVAPEHELFVEGSWYRGRFVQRVSPTPAVDPANFTGLALPPSSPYYPAVLVAARGGNPSKPIEVLWRLTEFGRRTDELTSDQWRAVAGAKGVWRGWDYALTVSYNANRQEDAYISGLFSLTGLDALMGAGVINPFSANTPQALEAIRGASITGTANTNRASDAGAGLTVSTELMHLPHGALALALGGEFRRETLSQSNADFYVSGDVIGGNGAVPSLPEASRRVWAVFGEVNAPVLPGIEVDAAVRHDHYSDFGATTNPKLSVRWQPMRSVLLRASWGKGFRAPTLSDLFQPNGFGFSNLPYDDPERCPVTQSAEDCGTPVRTRWGGNPALQPERSTQWNAGFVVEPARGVSIGADYFNVKVRNLIDLIYPEQVFAEYGTYGPTMVVRKPADPLYPALPGPIDYVNHWAINYGLLRSSGWDVDLRATAHAGKLGTLKFGLTGTYVIDYAREGAPDAGAYPNAGARPMGPSGSVARWRHHASLDWSRGAWGATLAQTFQSSYQEPCFIGFDGRSVDASGCMMRRVGSYSVWDGQVRYTGFRDLSLALGLRNLLDTAPPLSNQSWNWQSGFDPTYADPRGRMYYATLRYAFK